jgi:hypothetical protein|tara:strand:- start:245 stop:928 length:684 start_codon:yes stop_codon:yes gene_type:complete
MKIKEFVIMPHTADTMGLIHKPGTGPNNRFGFKNHSNNRANEDEHSPDLKLPTGKKMVLQAEDEKHTRGLVITSNEDGSYDSYYWYNDPKEAMPIEVKIDGESVSKNAKNVRWEYHPELEEEAAGVGIVTKQNATKDVPVGGEYMNLKKLGLGKGKPKSIREEWQEFKENFADKKVKGKSRPGRVKRAGASCKGSVTSLRAKAKKYSGEKGKMYHWCANMKSGRKKK